MSDNQNPNPTEPAVRSSFEDAQNVTGASLTLGSVPILNQDPYRLVGEGAEPFVATASTPTTTSKEKKLEHALYFVLALIVVVSLGVVYTLVDLATSPVLRPRSTSDDSSIINKDWAADREEIASAWGFRSSDELGLVVILYLPSGSGIGGSLVYTEASGKVEYCDDSLVELTYILSSKQLIRGTLDFGENNKGAIIGDELIYYYEIDSNGAYSHSVANTASALENLEAQGYVIYDPWELYWTTR